MSGYDDIPVTLSRSDWQTLLAHLNHMPDPAPVSVRLKNAVDKALTDRIDAAVNRFMGTSDGS